MVCEARFTKETSLQWSQIRSGPSTGIQQTATTQFVLSPKIALPGTSSRRCLHTHQVTEETLLVTCHVSTARMKMVRGGSRCHRTGGFWLRWQKCGNSIGPLVIMTAMLVMLPEAGYRPEGQW